MQKTVVFCLIAALGFYAIMYYTRSAQERDVQSLALPANTQSIMIDNVIVDIEFARTPEEHARGLMYRDSLPENHGMLFVFPDTSLRNFWNKNTLIPLDIIWIREGRVVGISYLPKANETGAAVTVSSPEPADHVLEVGSEWAARHGISIGSAVNY